MFGAREEGSLLKEYLVDLVVCKDPAHLLYFMNGKTKSRHWQCVNDSTVNKDIGGKV